MKQEVVEKKGVKIVKPFQALPGTNTKAKVERLVQQIVEHRIDITQQEEDWFQLACAFANEFGEKGEGVFPCD